MNQKKQSLVIYTFLIISFILFLLIIINQFFFVKYIYELNLKKYSNESRIILNLTNQAVHDYFTFLQTSLNTLTKYDDIIQFNNHGKELINEFYDNYSNIFSNVTRLNKKGEIEYTAPYNKNVIGKSVLYQYHNRRLFNEKIPIISIPFKAVQGYDAIAIAIPIIKDSTILGSITGLIPFKHIWNRYVSNIYITENSFVIVCDKTGNIIYSPDSLNEYEKLSNILSNFSNHTNLLYNKIFFIEKISLINTNSQFIKSDFYVSGTMINIDKNEWYILAFTPVEDIKNISNQLNRTQSYFTYLIIILLILFSFIILFYQTNKLQEKDKALYINLSEKEKILQKKNFYEIIINTMINSPENPVFITDYDGNLYFHNKTLGIEKNLFEYIDKNTRKEIIHAINFIKEKMKRSIMVIPLKTKNKIIKYLFNIEKLEYMGDEYLLFFGFEYRENMQNTLCKKEYHELFYNWINSDKASIMTDTKGNIFLLNNKFFNLFGIESKNILQLCDDGEKIISSFNNIAQSLNEVQLLCSINNKQFTIAISPVFDELLKVKYMRIDFVDT